MIADGGLTALHIAALNDSSDCVQLLLDLHANVAAVTFPYGSSMNLIGAGSTPLHYAAFRGNLRCCQVNSVSLLFYVVRTYFGIVVGIV
ncbi:E3 ubiquitin-protein ligase XBAT33 [Platanthera zijinensis]|uniref:E3 ubiquitin-protein ligase XBAT33 n=1 Tax=Platanthera zijinensis TaxID=2320716 RepID=A0AAP0GFC1_9ASPA